jgi:hypothetical protein
MDARDPTASNRSRVWWRCSTSRRGLAGDEGDNHGGALGAWGKTRARSGRHGELDHGHNVGAGASEGAEHSGVAQRRCGSTPARNYMDTRAVTGKMRAWECCSPRVQTHRHLRNGGNAWKPRVDGGGLRLHGEVFGERGLGEPEGLGRTEGCPELLTARRNSPRQRARRWLDGDRRTGARPRRAAAELPRRARGARERARVFGWGRN